MRPARIVGLMGFLALVGCDGPVGPPEPPLRLDAQLRQLIGQWGAVPIGEMPVQNPAAVQLGQALFFDKILSGNRDISCASCHQAGASLGDGLSLAVGTGGVGVGLARVPGPGRGFVPRNAPTLLNAGLGLYQMFWDARLTGAAPGPFRIDSTTVGLLNGLSNILAAQAMLPVVNRREMRGKAGDVDVFGQPNELAHFADTEPDAVRAAVMQRLLALQEYVAMFRAAFPALGAAPPRFEHAAEALATFQRDAFIRSRSPFDRYLDRDDAALTTAEKRGAVLFFGEARCSQCHNGPFLGAQQFANIGAPQLGPGGAKQPPLDLGVGEFQPFQGYQFAFRVAPLRNVELTAPYMHSGAYPTLEAVVRHYTDVPKALREYDVTQLAPAFRTEYHGDPATISAMLATLDHRVRTPIELTEAQITDLVAFLKSLTDPAARDLQQIVPARVPSGLPIRD